MMKDDLRTYKGEVLGIVLDDSLSDEALAALGSCYVSLQNLVVANGLEDVYGDRRIYEGALDRLYDLCRSRTAAMEACPSSDGEPSGSASLSHPETAQGYFPGSGIDPLRLSRLLPLQYDLLHGPMRVSELGKVSETRKTLRRFVEAWMQWEGGDDRPDQTEAEYGVLCCIADLLCYDTDEDRNMDPMYAFFRNRINAWTETLDADGCWQNIPMGDALQRLQILTLNANLLQDPRHDALTGKAVRYYTRQLLDRLPSTGIVSGFPAVQLYRLYDLNVWGTGRPDPEVIGRMAELVRREYIRTAPLEPVRQRQDPTESARLWLLSVLIDHACREASMALQDEYFARTA